MSFNYQQIASTLAEDILFTNTVIGPSIFFYFILEVIATQTTEKPLSPELFQRG